MARRNDRPVELPISGRAAAAGRGGGCGGPRVARYHWRSCARAESATRSLRVIGMRGRSIEQSIRDGGSGRAPPTWLPLKFAIIVQTNSCVCLSLSLDFGIIVDAIAGASTLPHLFLVRIRAVRVFHFFFFQTRTLPEVYHRRNRCGRRVQ